MRKRRGFGGAVLGVHLSIWASSASISLLRKGEKVPGQESDQGGLEMRFRAARALGQRPIGVGVALSRVGLPGLPARPTRSRERVPKRRAPPARRPRRPRGGKRFQGGLRLPRQQQRGNPDLSAGPSGSIPAPGAVGHGYSVPPAGGGSRWGRVGPGRAPPRQQLRIDATALPPLPQRPNTT